MKYQIIFSEEIRKISIFHLLNLPRECYKKATCTLNCLYLRHTKYMGSGGGGGGRYIAFVFSVTMFLHVCVCV